MSAANPVTDGHGYNQPYFGIPYLPASEGMNPPYPPPTGIAASVGSGGGGGGITAANYGGSQPNFTPTTSGAVAIDTSTGQIWWYFNGQWQ